MPRLFMPRLQAAMPEEVKERPLREGRPHMASLLTARPPTTRHIAGHDPGRSAWLTFSYPASRPNTACRNRASRVWRPLRPVRTSARVCPAMSVRPRASPRASLHRPEM